MPIKTELFLALALCVITSAGCAAAGTTGTAGGDKSGSVLPTVRVRDLGLGSSIKRIVIVIQENRSLNNIFAGYPGADAHTYGYMRNGTKLPLRPIDFNTVDVDHGWVSGHADYDNGKMDGYDHNQTNGVPLPPAFPYAYLRRSLVQPYWTMAQRYVLVDHMFATEFGGSFTAHLDLIAATTEITSSTALIDSPSAFPWSCDAPLGTTTSIVNTSGQTSPNGPKPCFNQFATMADTLDAGGVSWKYYAPPLSDTGGQTWTSFGAIQNVRYGADWSKVVTPQTAVLTDAANSNLPSVSWVIPDLADSDHAGNKSDTGPSWVAAVVNSIGQSKEWNSTAIVVLWDDWGGWYDDAVPPQLDYLGLGNRVACMIISPYAKPHYVSHTVYEFGSVLKFIEQTFGLASLGASDSRANSLVDSFDFTQRPRAFVPIIAPYPASHFIREKPSMEAPDKE
ncbi:MAG TPA: alkaline phosphatase family protein [Candidatus Acidoferrales bacterium]|nr:alkaline phosphatase family protein [Candidatus Acidoferrales bacterium]